MVVEVRPEDLDSLEWRTESSEFATAAQGHPAKNMAAAADVPPSTLRATLGMLTLQEHLERLCWQQAGRRQTAPAQRMADFVNGTMSHHLPPSSYAPGLLSSPLHFWLPKPVVSRLQQAFTLFGRQAHGFLTNEAVVIAVETRTSSPLRILRSADTLQHVSLRGLFPCGEGAGYAGGIVSAAVDGERCAEMCAEMMNEEGVRSRTKAGPK